MDRKALEQMLARGQNSPLLRYTLGILRLKVGEVEAATSHLQATLRQDARHSTSWKYLVLIQKR